MQLRIEQLDNHLKRQLSPIYLLGGDEPLLLQESADAIRAAAHSKGYTVRDVFNVERGFDWDTLLEASRSLSLFSEQRILEVRLPTGKPGDAGGKVLRGYAERPAPDTLLLVICGKLDTSTRRTKWVQALSSAGIFIPIWPIDMKRLPAWIRRRMELRGLRPTNEAINLLAERVEGNLLACAQEIEKLYLLHGASSIDARLIANSVGDSARFGAFVLIDSALEGTASRCHRVLQGLRGEGVEVVAVVGALSWELRKLIAMARSITDGNTISQVLTRFKVWDSRKAAVGRALERYPLRIWRTLLGRCSGIDRIAKGQANGNAWDELLQLVLFMAGAKLSIRGELAGRH
ncbi:MAG: DNA polymerase III subunit delta [Gammaproteobacteria bacterium]